MPDPISLVPEMHDFQDLGQGIGDIELTNYGYSSDHTPDTNSNERRTGRGGTRPLRPGFSVALDAGLEERLGAKVGALMRIYDSMGNSRIVENADRVPDSSVDGTGTVDLFLPDTGRNDFYGKISKIEVLQQGDGRTDAGGADSTFAMFANLYPEEFQEAISHSLNRQNGQPPEQPGQEPGRPDKAQRPALSYSALTNHEEYKKADVPGRVAFLEKWRKQVYRKGDIQTKNDLLRVNAFVDEKIESELSGRGARAEGVIAIKHGWKKGLDFIRGAINHAAAEISSGVFENRTRTAREASKISGARAQLNSANIALKKAEDTFNVDAARDADRRITLYKGQLDALESADEIDLENPEGFAETFVADFASNNAAAADLATEGRGGSSFTTGPVGLLKLFLNRNDQGFEEDPERPGYFSLKPTTDEAHVRSKDFKGKRLMWIPGTEGLADQALQAVGELPLLIGQGMTLIGSMVMIANLGKRRADEVKAMYPDMSKSDYNEIVLASGMAEMAIERLGVNRLFPGGKAVTGGILKSRIARILVAAGTEGLEEPAQSIAGLELASEIIDKDIDTVFTPEAFEERWKEAVVGAAIGGAIATPTVAIQARQTKRFEEAAEVARTRAAETDNPNVTESKINEATMNDEVAAEVDKQVSSGEAAMNAADKIRKDAKKKAKDSTDARPQTSTDTKSVLDGPTDTPAVDGVAEATDSLIEAQNAFLDARSPIEKDFALKEMERASAELTLAEAREESAQGSQAATLDPQAKPTEEQAPPAPTAKAVGQEDISPADIVGISVKHTGSGNPKGPFFTEPSDQQNFSDPDQPSKEFSINNDAKIEIVDTTTFTDLRNKGVTVANPAVNYLVSKGVDVSKMKLKEAEALAIQLAKGEGIDILAGVHRNIDAPSTLSELLIVNDASVTPLTEETQSARDGSAKPIEAGSTPAPPSPPVEVGPQVLDDLSPELSVATSSRAALEPPEEAVEKDPFLVAQARLQEIRKRRGILDNADEPSIPDRPDFVPNEVRAIPEQPQPLAAPEVVVATTKDSALPDSSRDSVASQETIRVEPLPAVTEKRNDPRRGSEPETTPAIEDDFVDEPQTDTVRKAASRDRADVALAETQVVIEALPKGQRRAAEDRLGEAYLLAQKLSDQRLRGRDSGGAGELQDVVAETLGLAEAKLNTQGRSIIDTDLSQDELGKLLNAITLNTVNKATERASRSSGGEGITNIEIGLFETVPDHDIHDLDEDLIEDDASEGVGLSEVPAFQGSKIRINSADLTPEDQAVWNAKVAADGDTYQAGLILWPEMATESKKKVQDKFGNRWRKALPRIKEVATSQGIRFSPTADLGRLRLAAAFNEDEEMEALLEAEADGFLSVLDVFELMADREKGTVTGKMMGELLKSEDVRDVLLNTQFNTTAGPEGMIGGQFNEDSNTISLDHEWTNPAQSGRAAQVMLHESLHALVNRALSNPNSPFSKLVTEIREELLARLPVETREAIGSRGDRADTWLAGEISQGKSYDEVFGVPAPSGNSAADLIVAYAATHNHELVANGITDAVVARALSQIPSTRPRFYKNAWQHMVDIFRRALKFSDRNAFTDLLETTLAGVTEQGQGQLTADFIKSRREAQEAERVLFDLHLDEWARKSRHSPSTPEKDKSAKNRQKSFAANFNAWNPATEYSGDSLKSIQWAANVIAKVNTAKLSDAGRRAFINHVAEFTGTKPNAKLGTQGKPPNRHALYKTATDIISDITGADIMSEIHEGNISNPALLKISPKSLNNDTSLERMLSNSKKATGILREITSGFTDGMRGTPHKGSIYAEGETAREIKILEEAGGKFLTTYEDHTKPMIVSHLLTTSPVMEEEGLTKAQQIYRNWGNLKIATENVDKQGDSAPKRIREENKVNKSLLKNYAAIAKKAFDGELTFEQAGALMESDLGANQRTWRKAVLDMFAAKTDRVKLVTNIIDRKGGKEFIELDAYVPLVSRRIDNNSDFTSIDFEDPDSFVPPDAITERHLTHGFARTGVRSNYYVFSGKETVRSALSKVNTDFHTLPQRQTLNRFFGKGSSATSAYNKINIGDKGAKGVIDVLKHVSIKQVNNEMNKSRIGGLAVQLVNEAKTFGYIAALSHIKQPINQLAPLLTYAAVNPSKAFASLTHVFNRGDIPMTRTWLEKNAFDIHSRELDAVLDEARRTESRLANEGRGATALRGLKKLQEKVGKVYIGFSDKLATEGIFIAEYMAEAKRNGTISQETYEDAFGDPSKVDEDALLKARRAVTNYNAESSGAKKGSAFQKKGTVGQEMWRNAIYVFVTHQASIASNINASISQITNATDAETRAEGIKGLAAGAMSEAIFVGLASGLFAMLALGEDDEDERQKVYNKAYTRALDASYTSMPFVNMTLLNSAIPPILDYVIDETPLSRLSKQAAHMTGIAVDDKQKKTFPNFGSPALEVLGVPGIGASELLEALVMTANAGEGDTADLALLYSTFLFGQPGDLGGTLPTSIKRSDLKKSLRDREKARAK